MSAILGLLTFDGTPVSAESLQPGLAAMAHYGADGSGTWVEGTVGLGTIARHIAPEDHLRLQPLSLNGLTITADARLDGRDSLCDRLAISPAERAGTPDPLLILRAYQQWGTECPKYLVGDYAFAIWDSAAGRLFAARDHIGVRPFYYYAGANRFAFATDINGLLALPGIPGELDEGNIAYFIAASLYSRHVSKTETFFRDTYQLEFGCSLQIKTAGRESLRLTRCWHPQDAPEVRLPNAEAYAQACFEQVRTAVADRLRGDFAAAARLSGGIDSSAIAVIAHRLMRGEGRPFYAFSWSPPLDEKIGDPGFTEHRLIDAIVAAEEHLSVEYLPVNDRFYERWRQVDISRQPLVNLVHEWTVMERARSLGVRRVLSGWGGDEGVSFHDVGLNAWDLRTGRLDVLRARINLRWLLTKKFAGQRMAGLRELVGRLWVSIVQPYLPDSVYGLLFKRELLAGLRYVDPALVQRWQEKIKADTAIPRSRTRPRDTQYRRYAFGYLGERAADWSTAGAEYDIDYSFPLLDRRVLEFAYGIPETLYSSWYQRLDATHAEYQRYIFRLAMADRVLPRSVAWSTMLKESPIFTSHYSLLSRSILDQEQNRRFAEDVIGKAAGWIVPGRLLEDLTREQLDSSSIGLKTFQESLAQMRAWSVAVMIYRIHK